MTAHTEAKITETPRPLASAVSLDVQWRLLTWSLIISDGVMLALAFLLASVLRFSLGMALTEPAVAFDESFYTMVVMALIPTWLLVFMIIGLYDDHNLLGGTREYALVFSGVSAGMLIVVFATFVKPDFIIARGWLLYAWLLAALGIGLARFWLRRVVYGLRGRGYFLAPTLIVGDNKEAVSLASQLVGWRRSGMDVLGFATRSGPSGRILGDLSSLGFITEIGRLVDDLGIREVVVATSAVTRAELVELFRELAPRPDVELRLCGGLFEIMTTGLSIKEVAYVPLVNVHPNRFTGVDKLIKGLLDYSIAVATCLVFSWLYLAIAVLVHLDSPGPVLHRREVLGQGGRRFGSFKFRTMIDGAEEYLHERPDLQRQFEENHKLTEDPRVTRLGRFLRKSSLDELPQMFNVILGQMSVVGPRMISPAEHIRYGDWDMNLLTVKPGITGLWQVSGRSERSYDERVQLDMNYIRNWNIWLDLQILMQTIPAVLRGRGAY